MTTPSSESPARRPIGQPLIVTWLVTAAWDFLCASGLAVLVYRSTFDRFWQGVASTVVGPSAFEMGARGVGVGLLLHLSVALTWSALFVLVLVRSAPLRRLVARPWSALGVAAIYGPCIWLVMSLVVIPTATGTPPAFGLRWWVQVFAHLPFVTLPLVFTARRTLGLRTPPLNPT